MLQPRKEGNGSGNLVPSENNGQFTGTSVSGLETIATIRLWKTTRSAEI